MTTIRKCFNVARDHDDSAETIVHEMDVASYGAGYELAEYAEALEAMAEALRERAKQVRREARAAEKAKEPYEPGPSGLDDLINGPFRRSRR